MQQWYVSCTVEYLLRSSYETHLTRSKDLWNIDIIFHRAKAKMRVKLSHQLFVFSLELVFPMANPRSIEVKSTLASSDLFLTNFDFTSGLVGFACNLAGFSQGSLSLIWSCTLIDSKTFLMNVYLQVRLRYRVRLLLNPPPQCHEMSKMLSIFSTLPRPTAKTPTENFPQKSKFLILNHILSITLALIIT